MNQNWCSIYSNSSHEITNLTGTGINKFKSARLRLPQLIVATHTAKQVGEMPSVKYGEVDYSDSDMFKELPTIVNNLLAYGTIFLVPMLNKTKVITYCNVKKLEYVEDNEELIYLTYTEVEKVIVNGQVKRNTFQYIYELENDVGYYTKKNLSTGEYLYNKQKVSNTRLMPSIHRLNLNSIDKGVPIYAMANELINDADRVVAECNNTMDLLRPIVGIPSSLLKDTNRGMNADKVTLASDIHRVFAIVPGFEDDTTSWHQFGGNFSPTSYLEWLNFLLHMISLHAGLGSRYFSYDYGMGLKTAREVTFNNNELSINQSLINQSVKRIVEEIFTGQFHIEKSILPDKKELEITMADNIADSAMDLQQKLYQDRVLGAIDNDTYIRESYKFYNENIEPATNPHQEE